MEMLKHQFYFSCPSGWHLCSLPLVSNLPFASSDTSAQWDFEAWQAAQGLQPSREVQAAPFHPGTRRAGKLLCAAPVPCSAAFLQGCLTCSDAVQAQNSPALTPSWQQELLCAFPDSSLKGTRQCLCIDLYWKSWRSAGRSEVQSTCDLADPSVWKHFSGCCWLSLGHPWGKEGSWWAGWSPVQLLLSFSCSFK